MGKKKDKDLIITKGGKSVWHDLEYPNADEMVERCELAHKISKEKGTSGQDEFMKLCEKDEDYEVVVKLNKKLYELVRKECKEDKISMLELLTCALKHYLKHLGWI
jgi:hypothetical protein